MVLPGEGARRASRSLSCGSVSPGKHASGAGKFRAAGVDNSTFRRIVGGTSERRIQRFEVGQARFVQRKSFAGEERAESAGACPAAAFRREAARWADDSMFRRIVGGAFEQRIQRFEAGQARFVQRNGSAGKERRASRSSSRGSVSPGKRASGVGKFRAAGVDNSTLRRIVGGTSEQRIQRFEAGQARLVQRKGFAGEECAEPVGACPAAAFRREATRWALGRPALRGWTILRSVESSGVRPSSGFSASKPVRRGSSSGRSSPGSRAPERRQRAFRFVESPENARQSSGFSASKPGRRGSSRGRVSPGRSAPK